MSSAFSESSPPEPPPASIPTAGPIAIVGPLSIPEILDRSFRALRARFGILTLSAAIVMVPLGVITALLTGRFLSGYFELLDLSFNAPTNADLAMDQFFGDMLGYLGSILLISFLYVIASSFVSLVSMHHIQRFLHGESSTFSEGLRVGIRRVLPLIWMQILQFLAIMVVSAVVAVAIGMIIFLAALAFGGAIAALDNEAVGVYLMVGMVIVFVVGYLVLILVMLAPAALFMGRWLAAAPSLAIEGLGPVEALRRSWELSRGRMWRGIIFVVLLSIFSTVVIGLPVGMAQWIAMLAMPEQMVLIGIISSVASYILNLFYQPFYATGTVLYYYDLRVRAEAYDVALRVAALEAELAPDTPPL